eukprot:CAMPEP_0119388262 /NCGR_PEP_ID=MMETSP1334-20130426/104247_1 /TAXON_ID=127549 /ORGANISM="Calcidiscus leptoporus, Strain RCC1130" /LENGTH=172 /DNA_ID=CAMNT_0007410191 /DNA_START=110 /DNA_END=625 /DNA_ORIENTATION=-
MAEALRKEVQLPDKSKEEFRVLMSCLQPLSMEQMTKERALFLSRWADEYQMDGLKAKCESQLVKHVGADAIGMLEHAISFNLKQLTKASMDVVKRDIPRYIDQLVILAEHQQEALVHEIWLACCRATEESVRKLRFEKLHISAEMPPTEHLQAMWPFLAATVKMQATWEDRW